MQKQKQNQTSIKRKNNLKKSKIKKKIKKKKQVKRRKKEKKKTYVFRMDLLDKIAEGTQASILVNISNSTSIQFTSEIFGVNDIC
jgi:hypothetical protein